MNILNKTVNSKIDGSGDIINSTCFSPNGQLLYTASDDNRVNAFEYPSLQFKHFVYRPQMPAKHISINKEATLIAIATLEDKIPILSIKKEPKQQLELKGHEGGTLCVAFDPLDKLIASGGRDGNIKIWNLTNGEEVKVLTNMIPKEIIKGKDNIQLPFRFEWSFDGKSLIIPYNKSVVFVERGSWKITKTLKEDSMGIVTMVSISKSYHHFICSDFNKKVYYFTQDSKKVSKVSLPFKDHITSIQLSPHNDTALIGDYTGEFNIFDLGNSFEDEERGGKMKKSEFEYDESLEASNSIPIDFSIDQSSQTSQIEEKKQEKKIEKIEEDIEESEDEKIEKNEEIIPFQPSSTILVEKRRFLVYNEVGLIICNEDQNSFSIEMEFHDVINYKNERFTDHYCSTMADLSENGAIFANRKGFKSQSSLFYKPFNSWCSDSSWRINMDEGEEIETVATGSHFIAASTQTIEGQFYLRIYSTSGLQKTIFSFPSQIITMAASKHLLVVVYKSLKELKYKLYDIENKKLIQNDILPISKNSFLRWIGFSSLGVISLIY